MDVTQLSGLSLSEKELQIATASLCMFGASGSGEYVRELQEFITLHAMALLDPGFHPSRQIYSKTLELIHFPWEFDDILQSLTRLEQKGEIENRGGARSEYRVQVTTISRLRSQSKNQEKFEKDIINQWCEELTQKYPDLSQKDTENLIVDLKAYILRILSQHAVESLSLYYGGDQETLSLIEEFSANTIKDILPERSGRLNQIRLDELPRFFKDASIERKKYIAGEMNSVFILHLLQLDPNCASLAKTQIPGGKLYLDTNFIFRLVGLQGTSFQDAAIRLKDLSTSLGYQMVVSPRTIEEYKQSLKHSIRKISHSNPITSSLAKAALQATDETDVYTAYWRQVSNKGIYINPSVYLEYYLEIEAILASKGIPVIDDEAYHFVLDHDSEVSAEETKLENAIDRIGRNIRHPDITNHDAFHRLLILQLRAGNQSNSFVETRFWFITLDSKLPHYDRIARSGTDLVMPYCVLASQWLQAIRPLAASADGYDITQVESLDSSYLRIYKSPPSALLNEIMSRFAMSADYLPEVAAKMFLNHHFLEQFEKAQTDAEKDEVVDEFYKDYIDSLEGDLRKTKEDRDQALRRIKELEEITKLVKAGDSSQTVIIQHAEYVDVAKKKETKMGDTNFISGVSGSNINIKSILQQTNQNIDNIQNADQPTKDEISKLVLQLTDLLNTVPIEKKEDADKVADRVDTLIKEAGKEKPDKEKVQFSLESLKKAAENIASVLPLVLPIAMKLVGYIQSVIK